VNSEILRSVLEEASALTASLPDDIRQVAFSKAFDALLEDRVTTTQPQRRVQSRRAQPRISIRGPLGRSARLRRVGPKQALGQLVDGGYFASTHGLPEIQRHLRDSYGHDFGSSELSISLLRLIRDGRLNRERNPSGQYKYWSATHKDQSQDTLRHGKNSRLLTDGAV
jgi:hypothetical protein